MDKYNELYIYTMEYYVGIKKNELLIWYDKDKLWKHAKWKKEVRKHHLLYESIYMSDSNRQIHGDRNISGR